MKHCSLLLCLLAFASCQKIIVPPSRPGGNSTKDISPPASRRPYTPVTGNTMSTVTIEKDINDMVDRTELGSPYDLTHNVQLATIRITTQGYIPAIKSLRVHVVADRGTSSSVQTNELVVTLRLYASNGALMGSETVPPGINPAVTFQNVNLFVGGSNSAFYTIKADVQRIDGNNVGSSVKIDITPSDIAAIEAFGADGGVLPSSQLFGGINGSRVYFYVNGIVVGGPGSTTNTYSVPTGTQTHGTWIMTIPFSVTAYGRTVYIPAKTTSTGIHSVTDPYVSAGPHIGYAVDNGTVLQTAGTSAVVVYAGSDNLTVDANGNYQIPVGQTKNFNLVVTFKPSASGSYRARLVCVNYNTDDSSVSYTSFTAGLNENTFRTSYVAGM